MWHHTVEMVWDFAHDTGWRRLIECLKSQVILRKRATNYRALLREMTYKDKASYGSSPPCTTRLSLIYVYMYVCIYIYIFSHPFSWHHETPGVSCICAYTLYVYTHVYVHVYVYIHVYIHIHGTHVYTHTHVIRETFGHPTHTFVRENTRHFRTPYTHTCLHTCASQSCRVRSTKQIHICYHAGDYTRLSATLHTQLCGRIHETFGHPTHTLVYTPAPVSPHAQYDSTTLALPPASAVICRVSEFSYSVLE